ncbi:hypothetical protein NKH77_53450 [Streptomyces sp. M19]
MDGYWGDAAAAQQRERFVTAPGGAGRPCAPVTSGTWTRRAALLPRAARRSVQAPGRRLSCQEVESAALDVPGVEQAACRPPGPDGRLTLWFTGAALPDAVRHGITARLGSAGSPTAACPSGACRSHRTERSTERHWREGRR